MNITIHVFYQEMDTWSSKVGFFPLPHKSAHSARLVFYWSCSLRQLLCFRFTWHLSAVCIHPWACDNSGCPIFILLFYFTFIYTGKSHEVSFWRATCLIVNNKVLRQNVNSAKHGSNLFNFVTLFKWSETIKLTMDHNWDKLKSDLQWSCTVPLNVNKRDFQEKTRIKMDILQTKMP